MRVAYPAYMPFLMIIFNRPGQALGGISVGRPMRHVGHMGQRLQVFSRARIDLRLPQ